MSSLVVSNANYEDIATRVFDTLDVRDATRHEYGRRIQHFLLFVSSEGQLTIDTLLRYKHSLADNELYSVSTRNKYLVCAKIFLRECYRLGLISRDITVNVKCFQQNKKHKVDGLNEIEVALVCQWIKNNPTRLREQVIICLLLFQGLRQSEICRLRLSDVRLADQTLLVLGKSRDDKEKVYLHPTTVKALRHYLSGIHCADNGYLFIGKRMASADGKLTECGLRLIIKGIFSELGIEKTVHGFRHYYTSRLIRTMPGELTIIAQFTRHKSLEMLQVYNDNLVMEKDVQRYYTAFSGLI